MATKAHIGQINSEKKKKKSIQNKLIFIGGTVALMIGLIGIFLPILPTTPFLLISAAAYAKSSNKFYNWLLKNKILGSYIRNYKEGLGMPLKVKIFTITFLWVMIIVAMIVVPIFWVQILLLLIAIAVSIHIILIKPKNTLK
jgi:hypothetical protein